jgi:hypothetical protein
MERGNHSHARSYISKVETLSEIVESPVALAGLGCINGVIAIKATQFKNAANIFTTISFAHFQPQEVAQS